MDTNKKELPFLKTFKTRPQICVKNIVLSGSELKLPTLEIQTESLPQVLSEIYPEASLIQLMEWVLFLEKASVLVCKKELLSAYNIHWTDNHEELLGVIVNLPEDFKKWSHEKKAQLNDLRPLLLIDKTNEHFKLTYFQFINSFHSHSISLGDGRQLLELAIDGFSKDEMQTLSTMTEFKTLGAKSTLKRLHKIKYKMSSNLDLKKQNFIKASKWPLNIDVHAIRKGDSSGFEVKGFVSSKDSILKIEKSLYESLKVISGFYLNQEKNLDTNFKSELNHEA